MGHDLGGRPGPAGHRVVVEGDARRQHQAVVGHGGAVGQAHLARRDVDGRRVLVDHPHSGQACHPGVAVLQHLQLAEAAVVEIGVEAGGVGGLRFNQGDVQGVLTAAGQRLQHREAAHAAANDCHPRPGGGDPAEDGAAAKPDGANAAPTDAPADSPADRAATPVAPDTAAPAVVAEADVEKEEFVGTAEKTMATWGARVDRLISATRAKSGELSESGKQALDDLSRKKDDLKAKLEDVKQKSDQAWTEARPHLEQAVKDLEEAYEAAAAEFQEATVAPEAPEALSVPPAP